MVTGMATMDKPLNNLRQYCPQKIHFENLNIVTIIRISQVVTCICSLALSGAVVAAKWTMSPLLDTSVSYYDNITLSANNKNQELVTQVQPGLSVNAQGRRLQLSSSYSLGYIDYFGSEFSDRFFNTASAGMELEAIKEHLFVSSTASISQQTVDPARSGGSTDPSIISDNRTETRTWSITPTLRNRFGVYANSILSNQYSVVDYSSNQINSSWTNNLSYSLSSGSWFNQLTWTGSANYSRSEQNKADSAQANGRVNYAFTDHWSTFILGRMQKYSYSLIHADSNRYFINAEAGVVWKPSRKLQAEVGGGAVLNSSALSKNRVESEQSTWRAKVQIRPTTRTEFEVGREQAAYGSKEHLTFSHFTRKIRLSSTYAEILITPQQGRVAAGQQSVNNIGESASGGVSQLNRAVTDDVLLQKRLELNASLTLRKVSLNANAFLERGEYQTTTSSDKRYGGNGGGQLKLGSRTNLAANASLQRYYFDNLNQTDNIYQFNVSASRTFSKHINSSLTYLWQKRNSNRNVVQYTSNQITAQLKIKF